MRAAVILSLNTPWEIVTLPDPSPKAGQVLIKVHLSGMCGTDVHVHRGSISFPLPLIAGHEVVGEIIELGAGVIDFKVGDRVGVSWTQKGCGRCRYCQIKKIHYCESYQTWAHMGGGNSELMVAWAEGCTLLPDALSDEVATPLFCAGFTTASGYFNGRPKAGEKIAVLGCGGLGHIAVQYVKAKGHTVFVLTRKEEKRHLAKQLGADEVIVTDGSFGKALADRGGVDIILHTSNSSQDASDALLGLKPEGRLVSMGFAKDPIIIDPALFIAKQLQVIGSGQNHKSDLLDILELAAQGKIKPMVEIYPFENINVALERLKAGKVQFRALIRHEHPK